MDGVRARGRAAARFCFHGLRQRRRRSVANPAVTIARALSDSFAGIAPENAPAFIAAELVGALLATLCAGWFWRTPAA
jgi:glycerol uptake facilitator-like aquaporin